jgi:dienelactone hydrolase/pimeloyl-ACP methyl ester carboxylesterase
MNLIVALFVLQDLTVLKPEDEPKKMLYKYLEAECGKHFEARRKAVAALKTPEDVAKRQADLRAKFVAALGGFPERTPLNARVTGTLDRDGYKVEKVIYESRPEHPVTANLYLPAGAGPFPGVLFPCGHYDNAKAAPEYQRACILLAKNGIAALAFDPISQGERLQLVAPDGKPVAGRGTTEHTLVGVGALLVGRCAASYLVWDGIRSLDYLASRPEIDLKKLGCLGNSGGGTQTSYLMALDERILCAVPNCYITSLERLFTTIGPQDAEQNIPGQVAFGMEHADYLTLRAPRPTQISATTRDFFDIQGAWTTFREAKRIYGVLGHAERADLFEFDDQHAISKPMRQSALRWFRRWLVGKDDAAVEGEFPVSTDAELQCTATGHAIPELKGRTVFDFTADREKELAPKRGKRSREELLAEVKRRIGFEEPRENVPFRSAGKSVKDGIESGRGSAEVDPGVQVPLVSWEPHGVRAPAGVIVVHGEGKAKAAPVVERLLKDGLGVVALDLRGTGETSPGGRSGAWERFFGSDWKESFLGMHLSRPLLGQRVKDVLTVATAARAELRLLGVGAAAPVALHAAALDPRVKSLELEGMVLSWSLVARTPVTVGQLANVVPGALESYDLPDLAAAMAPRLLTIRNPVDPAGNPVSQAGLEEAYAAAREAYRAAGAEGNLKLVASAKVER